MEHLSELLDKVMVHNTIRYSGGTIYFTKGEYVWNRKGYKTIGEAKTAIDQALITIKNSINK